MFVVVPKGAIGFLWVRPTLLASMGPRSFWGPKSLAFRIKPEVASKNWKWLLQAIPRLIEHVCSPAWSKGIFQRFSVSHSASTLAPIWSHSGARAGRRTQPVVWELLLYNIDFQPFFGVVVVENGLPPGIFKLAKRYFTNCPVYSNN